MELESIQVSLRRSSRKHACPASPEAAGEDEQDDASLGSIARKCRAIEHSDTGTPVREQSKKQSATQPRSHPERAAERSNAPRSRQTSTIASTLSHEDSVPADCCVVCRRRGGNYAYTCVYEDDSGNCKRCVKEKYKCRPATAEEIAKSEARCPQCKKRGLNNCWYVDGKSSCEPCIKWKKNCGAPTKRKFNANTRSFLGLPTPEPGQNRAAIDGQEAMAERSRSISTDTAPYPAPSPVPPTAAPPSRTQRSFRQITATASSTLESDSKQTSVRTKEQFALGGSQEALSNSSSRKTRTSTRASHASSVRDGRDADRTTAEYSAALLNIALVRGSSRASRRDRCSFSPLTVQEATPDDSAAEDSQSLATDIEMADDESADLQLITESTKIVKSPGSVTSPTPNDVDAIQASTFDSDDLNNQASSASRPHTVRTDAQTSRLRRSRARPSYVELAPSDASDEDLEEDDDEVWDPEIDAESMIDGEDEFEDAAQSSADEDGDEEDADSIDVDIAPEPTSTLRRRSQLPPKQGKGLDLSLPPLNNIRDITADMTSKAIKLGLSEVLQSLDGRSINVATMCSGTESPLLFLQMLSEALDARGEAPLRLKHHFSAEIDATKQAYIERNFHPPILFRDVRQLGDEIVDTATTAYGAEEKIPGNLDILIAGFVCKDLSSLNSRKKTVDDQGETGDTWRAIYFYVKRFQPGIVLLENVKSDKRTWDDVVSRWSKIGYEAAWVYCDTKNYYIPQTRERMYMIAINRRLYGKKVGEAAANWTSTMQKLQRQCSSPYEAFLTDLPVSVIDHSTLSSEPEWSLCKLRYDQIRSEQKLGTRRPITQWSENGTLHPPDYANRKWYDSQSSRVYDAIDVAHLLAAQDGYDSMFKMRIWDVSQNVDRFKMGMGLVPCITPGGCDFGSNRQDALSGSQTLVLQGMPLDKLHFAGETQRECQDLAGNAMSTTVIGASLISAILHGSRAFRTNTSTDVLDLTSPKPAIQNRLVHAGTLLVHKYRPADPEDLDIAQLLREAKLTSRLCACEGERQIAESDIKICSGCSHTACTKCASNPRHQYADNISRECRQQTTNEFIRYWRPRLPSRLNLEKFPNLNGHLSQLQTERNRYEAYVKRIVEVNIGSQQFNLRKFVRCDNGWKVVYLGDNARIELSIGDGAQWRLFVDCSLEVPSKSDLRKALDNPIARAKVDFSLLNVDWEVFVPSNEERSLHIRGFGGRSKSWRNLLGLPDYQAETVPAQIQVHDTSGEIKFLQGVYQRLPYCGTAEYSLYKRCAKPTLYLFLDPDPIGEAREDGFIFSQDCSRKRYGESRMVVARLKSAWRPWQASDAKEYCVDVMLAGSWTTVSTRLATSELAPAAKVFQPGTPLTKFTDTCTNAVTVLDVTVPEVLLAQKSSDFSWALEPIKAAPSLSDWQSISVDTQSDCECAPTYPSLLWSVDQAGKATPHENRKAAAIFERGVKTRCPVFHQQPTISKNQTRIKIGINIPSLVHRAKGRLARVGSMGPSRTAWRLLTDHADTAPSQTKFRLRSNANDAPFSGPLSLMHDLRGAQPQALAWMHAQEAGISLAITEVEEAVHHDLGWRAEARAQTTTAVRGGVLADLPSFGKTVTTIALIQSEFEVSSPETILEQNKLVAKPSPQLIDTAATLIVCPPHIAMQWQTELGLFLGDQQYEEFDIRVIRDFAELKRLTIDDLQRSRVVVVSWTVLSDDEYISELARVTAMPEPANSSCRAFDAWMDGVVKDLPSQVLLMQSMDMDEFKRATQDLLDERLQQPVFQATLPLRLQHGSSYQSYQTIRDANGQKPSTQHRSSLKRKSSGLNNKVVPLLHMFRFNRLVVDEYHYLNDYKLIKNMFTAVSVKKVAAHKRWILSGTPALANFTDISNIASFLGVRLGRFAVGSGKLTSLEKFLVNDQTAVERFLSKTEVMSHQWHQARHDRAQEFLDLFVRQNEASLGHIPCHEDLRAVHLAVAHHAVYLELSQHLISQRMQVKRLKNKAESDRVSRLNASLNNSKTAEDALLKAALLNETSAGESGLDSLLRKRSEQRRETEHEISRLMRAFVWHKRTGFKGLKPTDPKKAETEENTVPKLWASFTQDIRKHAWLGDYDATTKSKVLLLKAETKPTSGGFEELKNASKEKMIREAKKIMSHLRDSCVELALRTRSERFISNVQDLLRPLCEDSHEPISCDAEHCQKTAIISEIYLASQCGHLTCEPCLLARGDDENCVVTGCSCTVQAVNLIRATDLGSTPETVSEHSFGRKMDDIARLIKEIPADDQGLVFTPNDETVAMLGEVLDHHGILFYTPSGCKPPQAAKIIEEFKASVEEDPENRPKVLLLNLTSETAAGVNLTNANHIIFVSPLLVESQYKYDSAMTQAIARSRRYGQEKQVHIYHFAALRTIDVDILEHRHKRTNGITAVKSTVCMPSKPTSKEKTRLVKNKHGSMALVPVSWLADEKARKELGVGKELEKFTSLINFSETFDDSEE
ncbi:uncharacterized protein M421DRAFT_90003 [Didymella exigua CBS 183.55]|uniref:Helicase C-terminal domain-containing protein n=1 Tax=Didymella exigua CBS 183.55 TaxID=1150837 RepID=A0A6A5RTF2_9PLEO|nr:uncharacterized protein M421DRAFT_90003 [Didymella exigua CBS 183.55]KAF1931765.1 hypothetical protein M421DRAFT_90003 [Didymella exigua CBS 183.55]